MSSSSRLPRSWQIALGGTVLLIVALSDAYGVVRERGDRDDVLAHGRDAQARVLRAAGLESVLIAWTDEGGTERTAPSRTGKVFARTGSGATVPIRYDPASIRAPVILSEVPERERVDAFWLRSDLFALAGSAVIVAAALVARLRARRASAGTASR